MALGDSSIGLQCWGRLAACFSCGAGTLHVSHTCVGRAKHLATAALGCWRTRYEIPTVGGKPFNRKIATKGVEVAEGCERPVNSALTCQDLEHNVPTPRASQAAPSELHKPRPLRAS
eukprot:6890197-Prymnesium_polylepis.1